MIAEIDKQSAVYVSWPTFANALAALSESVPNRIDRTVFPNLSGGTQGHLLSAFRFLGLIDKQGHPTPSLHSLAVPTESERRKQLSNILRERYPKIFALDPSRATMGQLKEAIAAEYNVSGSTRERAIRFLLNAMEFCGVAVSPMLANAKTTISAKAAAPRRRRAASSRTGRERQDAPAEGPGSLGTARTVKLKSGGVLTLSASVDLFSLQAEDRQFIFDLIDRIEAYGRDLQEHGCAR